MNSPAKINQTSTQHGRQAYQAGFRTPAEYYQLYLSKHQNVISRRLHVAGRIVGAYYFAKAIRQRQPKYIVYGLALGYGSAWIGHFVFDKTKPASFSHPVYSALAEGRMFYDMVRGRLSLKDQALDQIEY